MPTLFLDLSPDAHGLRRRINTVFQREGWVISPEPEAADLVLIDSAKADDPAIDALRTLPVGIIVLAWGADDPVFAGRVLWRADGVVDRDDTEEDWLRAAHEVRAGAGWISPQLVPRYRAQLNASAMRARTDHDTWQRVLTNAEYDIARLVVLGHSNAEIAKERWVGEGTIKQHLTSVYKKLGIRGRSSLISLGYKKRRFPDE
ncbi:MAG: LuxR C-terminal-related transcriptional regulator [Streptosporangiaceae bacterium]